MAARPRQEAAPVPCGRRNCLGSSGAAQGGNAIAGRGDLLDMLAGRGITIQKPDPAEQ